MGKDQKQNNDLISAFPSIHFHVVSLALRNDLVKMVLIQHEYQVGKNSSTGITERKVQK
ncbi:MAG: hypothetical protein MI750_01735 [Xanthomonadales bacterium]|nr:hypothetical protein [Xanthomonadales bacterium]